MKSGGKKSKRKQSNISRALASSNRKNLVLRNFFELTAGEIRANTPKLVKHRHFIDALNPNKGGAKSIYNRYTDSIPLEKCLSWCLGLIEIHSNVIVAFLKTQDIVLEKILIQDYESALTEVSSFENEFGVSAWATCLQGTLLSIINPDSKRTFLENRVSASDKNEFFKTLTFNLTNRFDDPETLQSESKFFELKIQRSFSGRMLHFLMYKLLPLNFDFQYDYAQILDVEKDSSSVDIFICLVDFITYGLHSPRNEDSRLFKSALIDLNKQFKHHITNDLMVAYGLNKPSKACPTSIVIIDSYTAGDYAAVCDKMLNTPYLAKDFGLVELWAKSLARHSSSEDGFLSNILHPLVDIILKTSDYNKSCSELFAYCHAFSMFRWFRELRYFLEKETNAYSSTESSILTTAPLLISSISSPAKLQALFDFGVILEDDFEYLMPSDSVTARLFNRMRSTEVNPPTDDELTGIEKDRQNKFSALWYVSRGRYLEAISILETLVHSKDTRISQDASKSLVELYMITDIPEKAADVYVEAVLENIYLLSTFDSDAISKACSNLIKQSKSVSVPISLSLHSRFVGDSYDAALKYSFECFLKNNGYSNPLELLTEDMFFNKRIIYFLRYVCTPDVMKLYLYFEAPKEIEQCRIDICKYLLKIYKGDEELLFEVKDLTRKVVLREAVTQVQSGRIFSDANFLTGPASGPLKALYDRYSSLRQQDFSASKDEVALQEFLDLIRKDKLLAEHTYLIHIQDLVLNEKNSVFLKLVKLVRDEFAFGERGLNLYLSTRIRHGHFPTAIRKPLLDNQLLASKATAAASYKLSKNWQEFFKVGNEPAPFMEASIIEFSSNLNSLIDEVNDKWFRIFTIDQDISGISKEGEFDKSLFNYSVSALETYYLQSELNSKASYTEFVASITKWLWARTERNLETIRERLSERMSHQAISMLDDLGKSIIPKCGIEGAGHFPDAVARARYGLLQSFETVQGWFARAQGGSLKEFELDIPVQIVKMAIDVNVDFDDKSCLYWNGRVLNAMVDALFILFENAVSKSGLQKHEILISVKSTCCDKFLTISVSNNCAYRSNLLEANKNLDRYRDPANSQPTTTTVQGEGGSGFFKLWHLLEKDMGIKHLVKLGFPSEEIFNVEITIPLAEFKKVNSSENIIN